MKKLMYFSILTPLLFGFLNHTVVAQGGEPNPYPTGDSDSLIYESPATVSLNAVSLVRFDTSAKVYINWSAPGIVCTGYNVKYKPLGSLTWTTISTSSQELILSDLLLDTSFQLQIIPTGYDGLSIHQLPPTVIGTIPQTEPIEVSQDMFNQLMSWYTGDRYERTFCEFIHESDVHLFEKLSFLQKYVFDNEDFTDADTSTEITNWYPSRFDTSNAEKCLPNIVTNCRCQVITKGTNKATPGATDLDSVAILPKIVQKVRRGGGDKTFIDRFEAGAAKYVALRQNEGAGGSSYEMSNMKDGDDATSVTSEASEIQFFLACLNRGTGHDQGGGTTNLPDSCDCKRPLYVSYEYTTNLYIKTEKKDA